VVGMYGDASYRISAFQCKNRLGLQNINLITVTDSGVQGFPSNDIMGKALTDYYHGNHQEKVWLYPRLKRDLNGCSLINGDFYYGPKGRFPMEFFFRATHKLPEEELQALKLCEGSILDVGAGAGGHALALQQLGQDVTAIEISPLSIALMRERGVQKAICQDIFSFNQSTFDTILLMWNGIGLVGTLKGLRQFLRKAGSLLRPGGQIIFDSTDSAYVFNRTPSMDLPYYGEFSFQYQYRDQESGWFEWLYIDRNTLRTILEEEGWEMELLSENDRFQYFVRCRRNKHVQGLAAL
jgi:SAM-dependent methyltransferase